MSLSLLLALLETREAGEQDHTGKYLRWIKAQENPAPPPDWRGAQPERVEMVMRALYDILHSTVYPATPEKIGTVLARALSERYGPDDNGNDLQHFAKPLRASLRGKMVDYLDKLLEQYPD